MSSLWAYAYEILPPQASSRLGTIRTLLKEETLVARAATRTWSGRLVLRRRATNILIVSDAPERNRAINQRIEAEVQRLEATFTLTEALSMADHGDATAFQEAYNGNGR